MFCPGCGIEDSQSNQYCRACGTDLRPVRFALEKPDNITQSAISARDEIGRAFAQRIRETNNAIEMKIVAEDVLPQIEKFLESPEEKRLRRMRTGTIITSVGIGVTIAFKVLGFLVDIDAFFLAGLGLITFFIGLGFFLNGYFLTVPKKILTDKSGEGETQRQLDGNRIETNELKLPKSNQVFTSVVEETTQHLKDKQPIPRK